MRIWTNQLLVLFSLLFGSEAISFAQQIEYVDLRDLAAYSAGKSKINHLPTHSIMNALKKFPGQFFGPVVEGKIDKNSFKGNVRFRRSGPVGPVGYKDSVKKKKVFKITKTNLNTRQNTVFGIEFESVDEYRKNRFRVDVVMMIHDKYYDKDPNGFYFRRMQLHVDYSIRKSSPKRVKVEKHYQDIPLSKSTVSVQGDLMQRKLVIKIDFAPEYSVEGLSSTIYKVYPMGIGAFNIRTGSGMDQKVESMTREFKNDAIMTAKLPRKTYGTNLRSRTYPYYYKGRPFIAVLNNGGRSYYEIGFHYQITKSGLIRGFVSHGCIRLRDKDLYELEAFVFLGGQKQLPTYIANKLEDEKTQKLKHPHPKRNGSYYAIAFTKHNYLNDVKNFNQSTKRYLKDLSKRDSYINTAAKRYLWCKLNGKYRKLRTGGKYGNYRSVLDSDCLTKVVIRHKNTKPVIDYILGHTSRKPSLPLYGSSSYTSSRRYSRNNSWSDDNDDRRGNWRSSRNSDDYDDYSDGQANARRLQSVNAKLRRLSRRYYRVLRCGQRYHSRECERIEYEYGRLKRLRDRLQRKSRWW